MPAEELTTKPIHGHAFHLQSNSAFISYEFHKGESWLNAAKVPKIFFQELAGILHYNNLVGLVALQLLDSQSDEFKTELLVGL